MKNFIPFFALALMFGSTLSRADFSGRWVGKGTATEETWNAHCDPMEIHLEQTPSAILFHSHSFQCRGFRFYHDVLLPFDIREGKLFLGDAEVGELKNGVAVIRFPGAEGGESTLEFSLNAEGILHFAEAILTGPGRRLIIEGDFSKLP